MTAMRRGLCSGLGRGAPGDFPLVALPEEVDPDLGAIDPGQLAAAIGKAGRRQQQEEFLQVNTLDGTFDGEFGPVLGNVLHGALAPPGAIDGHHVSRDAPLEHDTLAAASLDRTGHGSFPAPGKTARRRAVPLLQDYGYLR